MKKLALAAAMAAGMMSFAAHAQEAPAQLYSGNNITTPKKAAAAAGKDASASKVPAQKNAAEKSARVDSKAIARKNARQAANKGRAAVKLDQGVMAYAGARQGKTARFEAVEKTKAMTSGSVEITKQGRIGSDQGVDTMQTASVGKARERPELVATARNGTKVIGGDGAAPVAAVAAVASPGGYGAIIARYASAYGVPVSLAHAVIRVESNFRPNALGSAGEVGLMQIKPSTARSLGYAGSVKGLYAPETNIKFGMKYLGMAHKLGGGSTCGTILKYNAGHGARRMNPVSAAYCTKVKRHLGAA